MISKEAAKKCQLNAGAAQTLNRLEVECRKIRGQREECTGRLAECRENRNEFRNSAVNWETRAKVAERKLDDQISPWTWIGVGAGGTAIIVGVLGFVLVGK